MKNILIPVAELYISVPWGIDFGFKGVKEPVANAKVKQLIPPHKLPVSNDRYQLIGSVKFNLGFILSKLGISQTPQEFISSTGIQDLSSVVAGTNFMLNNRVLDLINANKAEFYSNIEVATKLLSGLDDLRSTFNYKAFMALKYGDPQLFIQSFS